MQLNYFLSNNGRTRMKTLLSRYENKMDVNGLQYYYNGQKIELFYDSICIYDYFKNEKNSTIFVSDDQNLIGPLINVTFKNK